MAHPDPSFATADVPHAQFQRGLPHGLYRVVVNPERAQKYIQARLMLKTICLPILGIGAALAIAGYALAGLPLVAIGLLLPRIVRKKAPELLLHFAQRDAKVYQEALEYEILEVRAPVAANDAG
jgi:hypothetical protein